MKNAFYFLIIFCSLAICTSVFAGQDLDINKRSVQWKLIEKALVGNESDKFQKPTKTSPFFLECVPKEVEKSLPNGTKVKEVQITFSCLDQPILKHAQLLHMRVDAKDLADRKINANDLCYLINSYSYKYMTGDAKALHQGCPAAGSGDFLAWWENQGGAEAICSMELASQARVSTCASYKQKLSQEAAPGESPAARE